MRRWQLVLDYTGSLGQWRASILNKVETWSGVTDAWLTDWQTLKDRATQLLIKCKSGALVTRLLKFHFCLFPLLQDFAHIGHKLIWVIKLHCVQGKATSMKTNVLPADQFSVQPTLLHPHWGSKPAEGNLPLQSSNSGSRSTLAQLSRHSWKFDSVTFL